jgi:hypothetical protein
LPWGETIGFYPGEWLVYVRLPGEDESLPLTAEV